MFEKEKKRKPREIENQNPAQQSTQATQPTPLFLFSRTTQQAGPNQRRGPALSPWPAPAHARAPSLSFSITRGPRVSAFPYLSLALQPAQRAPHLRLTGRPRALLTPPSGYRSPAAASAARAAHAPA